MYYDTLILKNLLSDYSSPKSKLTFLARSGEYIRIRRGLYIKKGEYNPKTLANIIYGPSYISFEYALSIYGMIPERAETVTSAVYNKNKDKEFETPAGRFTYKYINASVYFYGIERYEENGEPYLIASKEKALCDLLYKIKSADAGIGIETLLFDDLRIAENEFMKLRLNDIKTLAPLYNRTVHIRMLDFLKKRKKL